MFQRQLASFRRMVRQVTVRTIVGGTVVIGTIEITTQFVSHGRSSKLYHTIADDWITPLIRQFYDPEDAHHLAIKVSKENWAPTYHPSATEQLIDVSSKLFDKSTTNANTNRQNKNTNDGLLFENPIGLAAGFDKDGVIIQSLLELGFGFVEIGSVTLLPQPGNPKPRLFRLIHEEGLINRYGFNSLGSDIVEEHLIEFRQYQKLKQLEKEKMVQKEKEEKQKSFLAYDFIQQLYNNDIYRRFIYGMKHNKQRHGQGKGLLGVNLGKNKTSKTPIEDYKKLIKQLGPYADYLVINVSSPNTPGLRDLQQTNSLRQLLVECIKARDELLSLQNESIIKPLPLLVKLAPDLTHEEMEDIALVLLELQVDGMILTNTSNQRPESYKYLIKKERRTGGNTILQPTNSSKRELTKMYNESGGLSGKPIRDKSTEVIRTMYALTHGQIPIIGVGGISNAYDAYTKLKAGASVVQIYTGMIYHGPGLVSKMRHELAEIMIENGQYTLDDVIGVDHTELYMKRKLLHHQQEEQQQQQKFQQDLLEIENKN